jgi:hypothetical protein
MPLSTLGPLPLAVLGAALVMLTRSALAAQPVYLGAANQPKAAESSSAEPSSAEPSAERVSAPDHAPHDASTTQRGTSTSQGPCEEGSDLGTANEPSTSSTANEPSTSRNTKVPYLRLVQLPKNQESTAKASAPTVPRASAPPSHAAANAAPAPPLSFSLPRGALSLPLNPLQISAWLTSWLQLPSDERFKVAIAALTAVLPLTTPTMPSTNGPSATAPSATTPSANPPSATTPSTTTPARS